MSASIGIINSEAGIFVGLEVAGTVQPILRCTDVVAAAAFIHGYVTANRIATVNQNRALDYEEVRMIVESAALDLGLEKEQR